MKQLSIQIATILLLAPASDWGKTPQRFRDKNGDLDILRQEISNFPEEFRRLHQPENWDIALEGFSPAYYDKVRGAIAINTVEQPTDQWAAASTLFGEETGMYTIRFTSLLESDGESTYMLRIDGKKVMEFQNPRIHGKGMSEYAPHEVRVADVPIETGSLIQVEFLPHSNGLVPEGEGFGFARARWKSIIDFIPQQ
ncbi:hypothetical protein [Cyclobacterium xiamenense]|uniref:hypothetical protein n=1 Tax=Cyclobacterium xiamenense TaxID=1297121 RepID=UPI0035CF2F56